MIERKSAWTLAAAMIMLHWINRDRDHERRLRAESWYMVMIGFRSLARTAGAVAIAAEIQYNRTAGKAHRCSSARSTTPPPSTD